MFAPTYNELLATIPDLVQNGNYVLGWVWDGGTGGQSETNSRIQTPQTKGFFGDYWAASFVHVQGDLPLNYSSRSVFQNDTSQYYKMGCISTNDAPGTFVFEPCKKEAWFRKPAPFKVWKFLLVFTPQYFM